MILRRAIPVAFTLLALALTACRPHDFPQYPPGYREYAYVTNGGSGTVTVIDVVNVRVDRELPVGLNPVAVAASPTRNEVYVVNSGVEGAPGSVSVINAESNTVAATIPVHSQPVSIDLDSTGERATDRGRSRADGNYYVVFSRWCAALRSRHVRKEASRSEEHTSELQSLRHLVCRLL